MAALPGKARFYHAEIIGNFNENQFPNDEILELKVGAQIMFIRNDASGEKRYFNTIDFKWCTKRMSSFDDNKVKD